MMQLKLLDDINETSDKLKEWFISNDNSFIYLVLFVLGIAIFFVVYNALGKEK